MPSTCWSGSATRRWRKMLAAYADNLTTREADPAGVRRREGDFEPAIGKFVEKIVASCRPAPSRASCRSPNCRRRWPRTPNDPDLLAQLASRSRPQELSRSPPLGRRGTGRRSQERLAHYVRARLHLVVGETTEALARLEDASTASTAGKPAGAAGRTEAQGGGLRGGRGVVRVGRTASSPATPSGTSRWPPCISARATTRSWPPCWSDWPRPIPTTLAVRKKLAQLALDATTGRPRRAGRARPCRSTSWTPTCTSGGPGAGGREATGRGGRRIRHGRRARARRAGAAMALAGTPERRPARTRPAALKELLKREPGHAAPPSCWRNCRERRCASVRRTSRPGARSYRWPNFSG